MGATPMDTSGSGMTPTGNAPSNNVMDTSQSSQRSAAAASSGNPPAAGGSKYNPTDQAVLEYLKSKGMGSAVLELQSKLKDDQGDDPSTKSSARLLKEQLEQEEDQSRNQRLALTKATGGGFGYDLDAAAPIIQWGVPDTPAPVAPKGLGVHEARAYLDAFCALQLWVLNLPDDSLGGGVNAQSQSSDAIAKAKQLIEQGQEDPTQQVSLTTLIEEISKPSASSETGAAAGSGSSANNVQSFQLPPSAKPELLAVTFALLVHTYCELLEVGMETTAHVLRDAFRPIYEPLYGEAMKDLYKCYTTEDMVRLNTHNSQHMEALQGLKSILVQIASLQLRREEVSLAKVSDPQQQQAQKAKIQEYNQTIAILQQKHSELSKRASQAFDRMYDLPFLRRARAVRWQLTMSTASYGLLAAFLNSTSLQSSLLAMSTLLQTKCELHVERREPLPFTPAIVLDDNRDKRHPDLNETALVNWATPVPPSALKREMELTEPEKPFPPFHLQEEYDDERSARRDKRSVEFNRALLIHGFRRLEALERKREFDVMAHPNSEKKTGDGTGGDEEDKDNEEAVISRSYQLANPLEPSILLLTLCANDVKDEGGSNKTSKRRTTSTLPDGHSSSTAAGRKPTMSTSLWEEAGIGLTCAKLAPPDGRRIAVGCDDAAVRIWDLTKDKETKGASKEVCQVLLGHKNGFPVFDVSWNKDGRSLLSAGGDGSIRLWDTMAQGPFGQVYDDPLTPPSSSTSPKKSSDNKPLTNAIAKEALTKSTAALQEARHQPDMSVPGLKPESTSYQSGAALAVYRGHAPNTPVWSVAFAPSGYYFASAGGDATARLWTTDRPTPVRLFAGHTSDCVHSVCFHPNTNYILTGSEDRTARLWDIQTGRCVRLLNGCKTGIHKVQVDPTGKYAVGADAMGTIHMWDLGTGKKVTEFRAKNMSAGASRDTKSNWGMLHAMAFSACGTALATGGDDQCVRIWDIQQVLRGKSPVVEYPRKSFPTRRTMILDLEFTKRNLLLSAGKYISAVPLFNPISD